ncbi:hypothetical protein LTR15_007156 [Elasticomyces elasticus]|nr:hypothetical protein LTR15_007156 [Elasticomyces elasticus]
MEGTGAEEAGRHGEKIMASEDRQVVRPTQQLEGRWEYLSKYDRDQAHLNFGDQAMFGFTGITHPTAGQIWRVREIFRGCGDEDLTVGIGVVWVPSITEKELRDEQSMRWKAPDSCKPKQPAKRAAKDCEATAPSVDGLSLDGISEEILEAKNGHGNAEKGRVAFVMEERSMSCE